MGQFTRIPQDTFNSLQMDAGVLLSTFDPTGETEVQDSDIITATTGGIHITLSPEYSDLGEDVDNCPNNMKELKHLDSIACTFEFTALGTSAEMIKLALGAADIDPTDASKIIPRRNLLQTDFVDIWWVGDLVGGGYVAVKLINALSTNGFDLQTTKNGKGQISVTLTGHVSITNQDKMPMEFYSTTSGSVLPAIEFNTHVINVNEGDTAQILATVTPSDKSVTWSSADTAVATVSGGVVTGVAEGDTIITGTITAGDVQYTDTCTVIVKATA